VYRAGLVAKNNTGVVGVYLESTATCQRFTASWLDGKGKSKSFSCNKYGNDEAFRLACNYRG